MSAHENGSHAQLEYIKVAPEGGLCYADGVERREMMAEGAVKKTGEAFGRQW